MNWVQCDRCELWFHLLCIGLRERDVAEDQDFICRKCTHKPPTPSKGGKAKKATTTRTPVKEKPRNVVIKKEPEPVVIKEEVEDIPTQHSVDIVMEKPVEPVPKPTQSSEESKTVEETPVILKTEKEPLEEQQVAIEPVIEEQVAEVPVVEEVVEPIVSVSEAVVDESTKLDAEEDKDQEVAMDTSNTDTKPEEEQVESMEVQETPVPVETIIAEAEPEEVVTKEVPTTTTAMPSPPAGGAAVTANRSSDVTPVLEKLAALPVSTTELDSPTEKPSGDVAPSATSPSATSQPTTTVS